MPHDAPHEGQEPREGPPPPPHHRMANDSAMKDEEVLRFAPPEIRRLWRRVVGIEEQVADVKAAVQRIEELLRKSHGGA